jgi:hypothetical protein
MKKIVPPDIKTLTEEDVKLKYGISGPVAERIVKNKIFQLLYMKPNDIGKISIQDLTNVYKSNGLDIRELRAVYASLPEQMGSDSDGKKKEWLDNIRNNLKTLTDKLTTVGLNLNEKQNKAYREVEKPKSNTTPVKTTTTQPKQPGKVWTPPPKGNNPMSLMTELKNRITPVGGGSSFTLYDDEI